MSIASLDVEQLGSHIRYRLVIPSRDADGAGEAAFEGQFICRLDENATRELQRGAEALLRSRPGASFARDARQCGSLLYRTLIPKKLEKKLKGVSEPLVVSIGPSLYGLPWEMLFDGEYWGLRFALGKRINLVDSSRELLTRPDVIRIPGRPRVLIVGSNPRRDLPFVEREVERLAEVLANRADVTCVNGAMATVLNVTQYLSEGYDLIHYCGHVRPGRSHEGSALVLADEKLLQPAMIEPNVGGAPIVFINGCASTRGSSTPAIERWEEAFSGVAHSFLFGGAAGVVGTLCDVSDELAAAIAETFYEHVINGEPIGEALRLSRVAGRDRDTNSPTWMSFVLYGNPAQVLAFPAPEPPVTRMLFDQDGALAASRFDADAVKALTQARAEAVGHSVEQMSIVDLLIALVPTDAFRQALASWGTQAAAVPPLLVKLLRTHVGSTGEAPVSRKPPSRNQLQREVVVVLERAAGRADASPAIGVRDILVALLTELPADIHVLLEASGLDSRAMLSALGEAVDALPPVAPPPPGGMPPATRVAGSRMFDAFGQLRPAAVSAAVHEVLSSAAGEALGAGDASVEPHHLLAALAGSPSTQRLLGVPAADREITGRIARAAVWAIYGKPCPQRAESAPPERHQLSPATLAILDAASASLPVSLQALQAETSRVLQPAIESLLETQGTTRTMDVLVRTLVEAARHEIAPVASTGSGPTPALPANAVTRERAPSPDRQTRRSAMPALYRFGRDLIEEAESGRLAPVIGRHDELHQIELVLARPEKSNVLLIGEAGVGKTAIVEGLAVAIAQGVAPPLLRHRRIIEIEAGRLMAGASLQGELEARVQAVLTEAEAHPEVILFLDEFHALVSLGGHGDRTALTVGNQMKAALARGRVSVISATTDQEFALSVERDPALMRRFRVIRVGEPSIAETAEILRRIAHRMETRYNVRIEDGAVDTAVHLADRYLPGQMPDKARDLIVDACAARLVAQEGDTPSIVTPQRVAELVATLTRIPIDGLSTPAPEIVLSFEAALARRVVGQDEAVARVASRLRAAHVVRDPRRPVAVLLFAGPSGVGKTELARAIAEEYGGDAAALVMLPMNEYTDRQATSKLLGVGPGWLGHDEEPLLIGALKKRPRSVVLLDEIDKAHPDAWNALLRIFEEGVLVDPRTNRNVNGREAIYVMTSNVDGSGGPRIGFDRSPSGAAGERDSLTRLFPAEFVNRIDDIVLFRELDAAAIRKIAALKLDELAAWVKQGRQVQLTFDDAVAEWIARRTARLDRGARAVARFVQTHVREPLGTVLLAAPAGRSALHASVVEDAVRFDAITSTHDARC